MARQIIDIGVQGNDGTGDSIRESFRKVNENFKEMYGIFGSGDTIKFTSLDDAPDSYEANQIFVVSPDADAILAKNIVGGDGILVDHTDPAQVTIISTGSRLVNDDKPTLGNHLNAANFCIGNLRDPSPAMVALFNSLHKTSITEDNFVISRGYADKRYLLNAGTAGAGTQIRLRSEPLNTDEYFKTVSQWQSGYAVIPKHGLPSNVTGSPFIYKHTGSVPATGLLTGQTYYVRYVDNDRLGIYATADDANSDVNRIIVNDSPTVSAIDRGDETLVDSYFDPLLMGNWLRNEALPRESVVRRQGDAMEGVLMLSDHPSPFKGVGTPNGPDDLQAATKFYVDSSSYSSELNLYVSTSGRDQQPNTPVEKVGRASAYAFSTIGRACQHAELLISNSLTEPGPYRQRLTYSNGKNESTTALIINRSANTRLVEVFTNGAGIDQSNGTDIDFREGSIVKGVKSGATGRLVSYNGTVGLNDTYIIDLLRKITDVTTYEASFLRSKNRLLANSTFIAKETVLYLGSRHPGIEYDTVKYEADIKLFVESLADDISLGTNANTLNLAKSFYSGTTRTVPPSLLDLTLNAFTYAFQVIEKIIKNEKLTSAPSPTDLGKRSTLIQDITGMPGEAESIPLISKLTHTVKDILNNGLVSTSFAEFIVGEPLEFGQAVPELQITIFVESGIYYEQLPIKVPSNVSIIGDDANRCIVRPAPGVSQSPWASTYFYRNDTFDGLSRTFLSAPGATISLNPGSSEWEISVADISGLQEGMFLQVVSGPGELSELTQVLSIKSGNTFSISSPPVNGTFNSTTVIRGANSSNLAVSGTLFGYHYLVNPSTTSPINTVVKKNKEIDVFLLNDNTAIKNLTVQGHGGFACVLDPAGHISSHPPVIQTVYSNSNSINKQTFSGGVFVDGFAGNLPANIVSVVNPTQLQLSGISIRQPNAPSSFYVNGARYQVNDIRNYNKSTGTALIVLDQSTPWPSKNPATKTAWVYPYEIVIGTPGTKSMTVSDSVQNNDLGYGVIAINNGVAELSGVACSYCWTSLYAVDGGQIRSLTGNTSYGEYGLRAKGRDPNEVPDEVVLADTVHQQAMVVKRGTLLAKNTAGETSIYVDNYWYLPYIKSEIEVDHTSSKSSLIETSISIQSPGSGYKVDDILSATGGTVEFGKTPATFRVTNVDSTGKIAAIEIIDKGSYVASGPGLLTNSPVGIFPIVTGAFSVSGGTGTNAVLMGSFLGQRAIYEISSVEETTITGNGVDAAGNPITKPVIKLNLDSTASNSGTQSFLAGDLFDTQVITIRATKKLRFTGIDEIKPVRPSAALELQSIAASNQILRMLAYDATDSTGRMLPTGESILSVDNSIDYTLIETDVANIRAGYGKNAKDTKIAIVPIAGTKLARINSGQLTFFWQGKCHVITGFVDANTDGPNTPAYIKFSDLPYGQGSIVSKSSGLAEGFDHVRPTNIKAGIQAGTCAFITVRISICRATTHDFLNVGSGGYNDTNFPSSLYGAGTQTPSKEKEVVEETQGRVLYTSTDQNGVFKIGKFFEVDQGTGDVTFNAPITLTDLNGLGFKKGTFVTEFSSDDTMQDNDSNSVPVESAIRGYIDKRLGLTHDSNVVSSTQTIGPGFLPLNGALGMIGNLNMSGQGIPNRIQNLAAPANDSDAATKGYVDSEIARFDTLKELKDVTLINPAPGDMISFSPITGQLTNSTLTGDITFTTDFGKPKSATLIGGITSFPIIDRGIISTNQASVKGGVVVNEDISTWPENGFVQINNEIFSYGPRTISSRRLENVVRSRFDTTPAIHAANSTVSLLDSPAINVKLGSGVIGDSNISAAAAIAQSKLLLNIAKTLADAPSGTPEQIQADNGVASFDEATFEVTNGFVKLKPGGVKLTEVEPISPSSALGNLAATDAPPSVVSMDKIVNRGISMLIAATDTGPSSTLARRSNGLNSTPLANRTGSAIPGTGVFTNVASSTVSGQGNGAKFTVNYSGGGYTSVVATYSGSDYQAGTKIKIDGSLLGGTSGVQDLFLEVESINIDPNVYYGIHQISTTAEANSLVKTDSNRNLGNTGDRFNTVYSNTFVGDIVGNGTLTNLNITGLLSYSVDSNVIATGTNQTNARAITKNINNVASGVGGGVVLPITTALGNRIIIRNETIGNINVYPSVGSGINGLPVNNPVNLPKGAVIEFIFMGVTPGSKPGGIWVTPHATVY